MMAGRPRIELTNEQVELIERLAGFGLTQAQIADCLPLSESSLSVRIRDDEEYPAISAAYARGRARDAEALSSRHRDIAMGSVESEDIPISDQRRALEWRLERQHKWASQAEVGGDGLRVVIETVYDGDDEED